MKVVLNKCYGGFSLSEEAYKFLGLPWNGYGYIRPAQLGNINPKAVGRQSGYDAMRTAAKLIERIEALGDKASGALARLKIVEIPDDVIWEITDHDGYESIEEVHYVWG